MVKIVSESKSGGKVNWEISWKVSDVSGESGVKNVGWICFKLVLLMLV